MTDRVKMNRREFMIWSAKALLGTSAAVLALDRISNSLEKEDLTTVDHEAVVDYLPKSQRITLQGSPGNQKVISCAPIEVAPVATDLVGPGVVNNSTDYDWGNTKLPEVKVNGVVYPILTSRTDITNETIEFIQHQFKDSNFIDKHMKGLGIPLPKKKVYKTLVVDYRMVKDNYWVQSGENECKKVYDNSVAYDPSEHFTKFSSALSEATEGLVQYEQVRFEKILQEDMPLTSDPNLTYKRLIGYYKRSINYKALAQLAKRSGVNNVAVFTGPAGMYESVRYHTGDGDTITIFGLNNIDQDYPSAVHSWTHFFEDTIAESQPDLFNMVVGRNQEYDIIPYLTDEQNLRNYNAMNNGTTYAAIGIGSVHLPPNAISQYHYESQIPVILPGSTEVLNANQWNNQELDYYKFWLKNMPKRFFTLLNQQA